MNKPNYILSKGQTIDEKYKVTFFLKKGSYAETYRVKDQEGKTKLLKLFAYSKLDRTQFNDKGDILEIEILKQITHPNLVKYSNNGKLLLENQKYAFVILDFISGETLAEKMKREQTFNTYEAKDIISGVLNGLNYLHNLENPIIHNDITNLNIMTDLSGKVTVPKIIDFGYARYLSQSNKDFLKEGLNPFYQANENFNKVFSVQSDVFSVGALYYHLLFGLPPWFVEISKYKSDKIKLEDAVLEERKKPLKFEKNIDEQTQNIITKALQPNSENRFKSIKVFIQAINGELGVQQLSSPQEKTKPKLKEIKNGQGFSAIAGMQELKDTIQLDVIDALNEKERYAEYGLTIPNGMLLYGPPGCGKTFFAERMAEEIGFNFYQIKPSDIQSKFVNASQENIKNLFDEARENAPSIIFIDELDALVPNRDNSSVNHMNTSAVNEFLAQMNNCGDDGVFIIGATNRPNSIDPAILRAGRLDKVIYLPPPDFEARELMFKLYLDKRPREVGLDYSVFAKATENYVSSDIKFLCDEASRKALKMKSRISKEILLETITNNRPSISLKELNSYIAIKAKMEGLAENTNERPSIGFKNN
ncbi:AAA family ATPase [Subsaximicrobium wynnwilliamsii]|uniref:AAA family ATPase n=1 Tax=Subsaximicrobium wynnwilliamsii TaxID=291179 RepID=A0A5C6ZAB6_9FLAO|nr:AAA family ATPase [Subsaximicrobium wynnwilliamsii]TXD81129.1 AAA family ATPase [Subsaximicrobium wynnwilliamsii]TXD86866.1 AAA family ATPase [Subsaximicrobium wynnwilliamsii]TXE00457.1 AAA family ATPase [Subsaximicrobium wynnwilliamsii]